MRKAEAMKAWDEAHSAADEYIAVLATKGVVGTATALDTDEGKAKAALHELAKIALGPGSLRNKAHACRLLLTYTKTPPEVRNEIGLTAEGLLAMVQDLSDGGDASCRSGASPRLALDAAIPGHGTDASDTIGAAQS
jgi:hypothetical protein